MSENIGQGRTVTMCPECRQADDHPKHALLTEDPALGHHVDCHAEAGCPSCAIVLAGKTPGAGAKMLAHIAKRAEQVDLVAEHTKLAEEQPQYLVAPDGYSPTELRAAR